MRPSCTAVVKNLVPLGYNLFDEFSLKLETPPPTIPREIREWSVEHGEMAEKWKASFTDFQSRYYRQVYCARS